jgi:hypothetical protein
VACGTKAGKTTGASCAVVSSYLTRQQKLYRWVAPIYSQAKIGFNNIRRMMHRDWASKNLATLTLLNDELENQIEFRSGRFPEDLEGEAVSGGYVLDECAKMVEQVYDSAKTTLTVTRAPMINISTPRGKNWFYRKCMEAKQEMEWSLSKGRPPEKIFITEPSIDNPLVTLDAIEDARRSLPDRLFKQYYLAEFIDDGSVFSGVRDILFDYAIDDSGSGSKWVDANADACDVVVGVDWAKTVDFTVMVAFDIVTGKCVGFWRYNRISYTESIRRLMIFCKNFKNISTNDGQ